MKIWKTLTIVAACGCLLAPTTSISSNMNGRPKCPHKAEAKLFAQTSAHSTKEDKSRNQSENKNTPSAMSVK